MRKRDQQSYKTLFIALTIIGIFLTALIISQAPQITANLRNQDSAKAGALEPEDEEIPTLGPNETEAPDEPLEDDDLFTETPSPTTSPTPFPTVTVSTTATPLPTFESDFETETPAPTFDVDIPGETTPTISPTPRPATQGTSNIGLIIGAVVGTILLVIGIVWVILSRQKQSTDYTMPAPPSNPTYPPYQPDSFNSTPTAAPPDFSQTGETQAPYTTPYDQYVGNDPNQPK